MGHIFEAKFDPAKEHRASSAARHKTSMDKDLQDRDSNVISKRIIDISCYVQRRKASYAKA